MAADIKEPRHAGRIPGSELYIAEARGVVDTILADRIRFDADSTQRRYRLTLPIAFDRLLTAVVPEWGTGLQVSFLSHRYFGLASPTGFEPVFWP